MGHTIKIYDFEQIFTIFFSIAAPENIHREEKKINLFLFMMCINF